MHTELARRNGARPVKKRALVQLKAGTKVAGQKLPEYLYPQEVEALIRQAPHAQARLVMLCQWRAGLRVSEALALEVADLGLADDNPTLRVRRGKGNKARLVPIHPELAVGLGNFLDYSNTRRGKLFSAHRSTAWRWVQDAAMKAIQLNQLPQGKEIGTHTLRHSFARHVLANGVPLNVLSKWLGHASIQTTLIYLEILPDPTGYMDRVP